MKKKKYFDLISVVFLSVLMLLLGMDIMLLIDPEVESTEQSAFLYTMGVLLLLIFFLVRVNLRNKINP